MLEALMILMCTCGEPTVVYLQDRNEVNIAAYGQLDLGADEDRWLRAMCRKAPNDKRIQVWPLDKLNGKPCATKVNNH